MVLSQNDLFNNVGWFGNGIHHNPALRYNTDGVANHSGVIVENRIKGGTMAAVFEPANASITAGAGEVMVERNFFIGTEPTYYGIRSNYGNMTLRNNVIAQPDVLSTTNTYSRAIYFAENYQSGKTQDPENFAGPVEIYHNTIVNFSADNKTAKGDVSANIFAAIYQDQHHAGSGDTYSDFTAVNNLIYAPQTRNADYFNDPGFDLDYIPQNIVGINNTLPGLFDTLWGDARQGTATIGAAE